MLRRAREPATRERRFKSYDGEWYPDTMRLRMVGVFDGERYSHHKTVGEFVDAEFTPENSGTWYFAHAGGLADVQYVFEVLVRNDAYRIEAAFSGSSAIIVDVHRGRHHWRLLDSYWMLRESLAKIGAKLGMPKGEVDFWAPIEEIIPYNEQDCRILWTALDVFQRLTLDLGGEMQATIASTALHLFRRQFLTRDLPTSHHLNGRLRGAYSGGRTEVFDHRPGLAGDVYDVNSSYPHAMLSPQPGTFLRHSPRFPTYDHTVEYVADLTVVVPDCDVPPLPYVHGDSLFFPTGRRRAWVCKPELEWALERGARIEEVHEVCVFDQSTDLAAYATRLYELRRRASGYMLTVYKYLLNALYGKFGETTLKTKLLVRPTAHDLRTAKAYARYKKGGLRALQPGVYILTTDQAVPHEHVPFAANITAIARVTLGKQLVRARPYYCDTDSIATARQLPTSDRLGAFKLEKRFSWAHFAAPKLYAMQLADEAPSVGGQPLAQGDFGFGAWSVRGKGFRRLTMADFRWLLGGGTIEVDRMLRIRELLGKGKVVPEHETIKKRAKFTVRPKRRILEDGTTEPWDVRELEEQE